MTRDVKTLIGAGLIVLSWVVAAGSLNLGLGREEGHLLAVSLFAVACLVWSAGYRMLAVSSRTARVAALFLPTLCALSIVLAGVLQIGEGYWDWFPLASACIVGVTLAAALARRAPQQAGPGSDKEATR